MKQKVKKEIFIKSYPNEYANIRFKDLPADIQENDIIDIRREGDYRSENNSYDAYTDLVVIREREETDEEYQERISSDEIHMEELRKRRYQNYLKLKAEFESEQK